MTEAQQFEAIAWLWFFGVLAAGLAAGRVVQRCVAWMRPPYPNRRDPYLDAFFAEGLDDPWHRCLLCGLEKPERELEPALPIYMPEVTAYFSALGQGMPAPAIEWKCRVRCPQIFRPKPAA